MKRGRRSCSSDMSRHSRLVTQERPQPWVDQLRPLLKGRHFGPAKRAAITSATGRPSTGHRSSPHAESVPCPLLSDLNNGAAWNLSLLQRNASLLDLVQGISVGHQLP
jgi:hypothetical protein